MQVGLHVSIAGSIDKAVDNAVTTGCTAFQIFTRNPRGWAAKPLSGDDVTSFKEKLANSKIDRLATVAHMPYLPNLSSPDEDPFARSLDSLIDEIKRCSKIGIPYIVAHLGSHKGKGDKKGIEMLIRAFTKAAIDTPDDVMILLENTAGQKNSVGSDLDQLGSILAQLKPSKRFGICFDTCHAFAFGYDMSTEKGAAATLERFDSAIGFEHLKILHLNDSKGELGSNLDRHEHIGLGYIGEKGMRYIIKAINRKKIPIILETPIDERRDDVGNLNKVKELAR
ncbi:MAG: deoxyribonuclease IV [Thaumarchaeota archaeon]|nr:deoxyribonuclease IV [Nitrososphaerota archaeon]